MSKTTPGPWIVAPKIVSFGYLNFVGTATKSGGIAEVYNEHDTSLIAACPEMLEALRVVDSWARKNYLPPKEFELVLDAIAKAEGKE